MTEHLMWRWQSIVTPVRPQNTCKSLSQPSGAREWSGGRPLRMLGKAETTQKKSSKSSCKFLYTHIVVNYIINARNTYYIITNTCGGSIFVGSVSTSYPWINIPNKVWNAVYDHYTIKQIHKNICKQTFKKKLIISTQKKQPPTNLCDSTRFRYLKFYGFF